MGKVRVDDADVFIGESFYLLQMKSMFRIQILILVYSVLV